MKSGNPRPEYQVIGLNFAKPFGNRSFYGYTILARTPDRAAALQMELGLVDAYKAAHNGFRPPMQIRP